MVRGEMDRGKMVCGETVRGEALRGTQNPFEVNLTILGVKIGHDHKWGYHNPIQACAGLR
jgi:hypothetical protein